ncbi:solute carrier family 35 member G1-like [Ciona intestinalis]
MKVCCYNKSNCRSLGILYSVIAAIFGSLAGLSLKVAPSTSQLHGGLSHFILAYTICLPISTFGPLKFEARKWNLIYANLFGIMSSISTITNFLAFEFLPMSDVFAIVSSSAATTMMLACVFLKENCTATDVLFSIVALVGVVLVAQPNFLFHGTDYRDDRYIGTVLALACNFSTAFAVLITRKLVGKVNTVHLIISRSFWGILFCAVSLNFVEGADEIPCLTVCAFLCLSAVFGLLNWTFRCVALMLERAGPVIVAYSSLIGFAFLLDYFVLGTATNLLSIMGAIAIFASSAGIALKTTVSDCSNERT